MRNKIVQEITRNVANVFSFYAIIATEHVFFKCINIRQVPREVLKIAISGLGFQHLPRDLANINAWKTMFDPYIGLQLGTAAILVAGEGRGRMLLFRLFLHFH